MAKLKQHTKIERVVRFLLSFNRADVATRMALRGFSAEDRKEGFKLLDKAVGRDLALNLELETPDKNLVAEIDAWENIWFDVADAALARSYPEVHAKVLDRLAKTSGPMVILNVKVLLDRLEQLENSGDPSDAAALALLAKRGLDHKQRQRAADLIEQARSGLPDTDGPDTVEEQEVDLDEAVAQMWAWYLDWAKTARTVIRSKRLRIVMGLSTATRSEGVVEEYELEEDEDGEEAA